MGSGIWNVDTYARTASVKKATGTPDFAYSKATMAAPAASRKIHPNLDPMGVKVRESRDSDEHPDSVAVAVFFDVTGSMGGIPVVLQKKLPTLMGTVLRKGYLADPQILFGAVGDATCDQMPLQVGQFESDNRADENLELIVLEGGGGGGNHESYELAAYFLAHHTAIDCFEKRGRKGYAFFIGDERLYARVSRDQVARLIGTNPQADLDTRDLFRELQERYEVFFLFAKEGSYQPEQVIEESASGGGALGWKEVLPQNTLVLDSAEAVCEAIALAIGVNEGVVDVDTGVRDLVDMGASETAARSAGTALSTYVATVGAKGALATVDDEEGALATSGASGGATRL